MIPFKAIQATCDDIVREFSPLQVILFGSYAYGTPTEDSDVDLLVVMSVLKSETRRQEREIKKRIPERFRLDLHVRSPDDIAYRISRNDWFLRDLFEKGDVLYATEGVGYLVFAEKFSVPMIWKETGFVNPLTLELVQKAEDGYTAVKWLQQSPTPVSDPICFHAQQCIEKYLKAWLQEANLRSPRTHDLKGLLALIVPSIPAWQAWEKDVATFDKYAVDGRYPGYFANQHDVEEAVRICAEIRRTVRAALELPIKEI